MPFGLCEHNANCGDRIGCLGQAFSCGEHAMREATRNRYQKRGELLRGLWQRRYPLAAQNSRTASSAIIEGVNKATPHMYSMQRSAAETKVGAGIASGGGARGCKSRLPRGENAQSMKIQFSSRRTLWLQSPQSLALRCGPHTGKVRGGDVLCRMRSTRPRRNFTNKNKTRHTKK